MHERKQANDQNWRGTAGAQSAHFTIVEFHPGDDLAGHLHKPGRRNATDFLCLDARASNIDSLLDALDRITKAPPSELAAATDAAPPFDVSERPKLPVVAGVEIASQPGPHDCAAAIWPNQAVICLWLAHDP